MQAPITIYSGSRVMKRVNVEQVRILSEESLYGPARRVCVDLFGGRTGEHPKLGLTGEKASVVSFLRRLASQIESKE